MGHRIALFAGIALLALAAGGCTKDEDPVLKNTAKNGDMSAMPGMTPDQMEKAHSETEGAKKEDLDKLSKDKDGAKAAFEKAPKDDKAKKAYVDATVRLGTATMMSPDLSPREKYAGALKLYREALKLDPKNEEALSNKQMIEDIYKQMGRPVPE